MCDIHILNVGFSKVIDKDKMLANCTCTLVRGPHNLIIDTMTAWDAPKLVDGLNKWSIVTEHIDYVISTHGHSDHLGNNNLFLNATHIVGFGVSKHELYFLHPFEEGKEYVIDEFIKVIPTPGHTHSDVTVMVQTQQGKIVAIAGDLFENAADIFDETIWLQAGSENPTLQRKNRAFVSKHADFIIPGHGDIFEVTPTIKVELESQFKKNEKLDISDDAERAE